MQYDLNLMHQENVDIPVFSGKKTLSLEDVILGGDEGIFNAYADYGCVLFRDFVDSDLEFLNRVSVSLVGPTMEQQGRHTIRKRVSGAVHSSTERAKTAHIVLHSENAYMPTFPRSMFFYCALPSESGGRTPIANVRAIQEMLPDDLFKKVRETGVKYVRRIGVLPGQDWREVYKGFTRDSLSEYLHSSGTQAHWDQDVLTTVRVLPGVLKRTETRDEVWMNALYSSNSFTLPGMQRDLLVREFGEDGLPGETYFGSGERLSKPMFEALETAHNANKVSFEWQKGDLLWLDNTRFMHGRDPYKGDRRILAVLGSPANWNDFGAVGSQGAPSQSH